MGSNPTAISKLRMKNIMKEQPESEQFDLAAALAKAKMTPSEFIGWINYLKDAQLPPMSDNPEPIPDSESEVFLVDGIPHTTKTINGVTYIRPKTV